VTHWQAQRGEPTAEVRRVQLSAEERRVVLARDSFEWARDAGLLLAVGILATVSLSFGVRSQWTGALVALALATGAGLCLLLCWLPRWRQATRCQKEVVRGLVTRKQRTHGKRPVFYVFLGELEAQVDHTDWRRLRVGDEIELHRSTLNDKAFAVFRHRPSPPA
jgi:hypothetical protein